MKVSTGNTATLEQDQSTQSIRLPQGLIGFPDHKSFDLFYNEEQLPFRWMRLNGNPTLQFVVIEPGEHMPDYEMELFDEDAAFLDIQDPSEVLVLNIVTTSNTQPATATVNLVGPVIINRRTGVAKQVVLSNYSHYSARHPLVDAS